MPRYFFHVRNGSDLDRDSEGHLCPDAEAARREAINAVREILSEKLLHGGALNHRSIEIADETGHVVDVVNSRDLLFNGGRFRSYADDVTHPTSAKPPHR
jgi:hypothetical protein